MKRSILSLASIIGALAITGCDRPVAETDTGTTAVVTTNASETVGMTPTPVTPRTGERVYGDSATTAGTTAPDNTSVNVRDRNDATLTPGDQGGTEADREITRKLRRAITANDSLSTTASNIKIITANGLVTLRGPVNSEQEKQEIQKIAQQQGITNLDNQLEVKPATQADTDEDNE